MKKFLLGIINKAKKVNWLMIFIMTFLLLFWGSLVFGAFVIGEW
jgi:hypothetical protein